MKTKTALLVGASGLIGRHCLDLLLMDEAYTEVTVLVRGSLNRPHAKLTEHVIDFHRLPEYASLIRAQHVFCCIGTTLKKAGSKEAFYKVDFTYPHQIARMAWRNGAEQFLIVTALGADPQSRFFYNRVKGEVEQAVAKIPFHGVHIFRPSLLVGPRQEARPKEQAALRVAESLPILFSGSRAKYRPIEASDVARAMVRVAKVESVGVHFYESDLIRVIAGTSRFAGTR